MIRHAPGGGRVGRTSLKILMVTSEVVPFAKAGGLGDMVAALSSELSRQGHDVRIILPRYYSVDVGRLQRVGGSLGVPLGTEEEWCAVYAGRLPDAEVTVYFLDHQELYGRDGIYGTRSEPSFPDNLRRLRCSAAARSSSAGSSIGSRTSCTPTIGPLLLFRSV